MKKAEQINGGIEIVKDKAEEIQNKATGTWNKLEEVFQARVARALHRLGVPSRDDMQRLFEQVDLLSRNVEKLTRVAGMETKPKKIRAVKPAEPIIVDKSADPVA